MSKLNVDQKSIFNLLSEKKADFLIPDYQRPYAWEDEECQTLWDDIFEFAIPDRDAHSFNDKDEYFLGAIVTYKNDKEQSEVIDGQQRLTTLLLLLRAFYDKFEKMQDKGSVLTRARIESCIWKTDAFGEPQKDLLKINSEVATDNDKEEFIELLKTGAFKANSKSQYVKNFRFFQERINEFLNDYASYFPYLPARILDNCILLPIEAESQDTALRIFSTLNDRGLPLSDADIFKAQFYKFYGSQGRKDEFIKQWKELEEATSRIFRPITGTPMDELFTRYMYYLRAKEGIKSSTTEALRKFYERDKYRYFQQEQTIENLKKVIDFWLLVEEQNTEYFSDSILKKLYTLHYAPNGMWQHMVTAYFLNNRNEDNKLEEQSFAKFLDKITAFIFAFAITNPGVNALRTPAYDEMVNIVNNNEVTFLKYQFDEQSARSFFESFKFTNQRTVTRSLLTWYAFTFEKQSLPSLSEQFQIEHIYAKKRQEMEKGLQNENSLELLGNKVLLEQSINIRAADYRFEDKTLIYKGTNRRGKNKEPSQIAEVLELAERPAFAEDDVLARNQAIINKFFDFLRSESLLKQ